VLRRAQLQGCRTLSGKDYCIIWPPEKPAAAAAAAFVTFRQPAPGSVNELLRLWGYGANDSSSSSSSSEARVHANAIEQQLLRKYRYEFNLKAEGLKDKVRLDKQLLKWMVQRQGGGLRGADPVKAAAAADVWSKRSTEAEQQVSCLVSELAVFIRLSRDLACGLLFACIVTCACFVSLESGANRAQKNSSSCT
jgi:hypothetical protein